MYQVSGRISLIEGNAESFRLKSNLEKYFAATVYLSQAVSPHNCPLLLRQSGQIYSQVRFLYMYFISYFSLELPPLFWLDNIFKKDN
jgi:hypothetical protein